MTNMNVLLSLLVNTSLCMSVLGIVYVRTKLGSVKGSSMLSRDGRRFKAFMGLPYAKPPVGDLRFKDPQRPEPWQGTLDATKYPPRCPQAGGVKGFTGQEDCLYLNVYTPMEADSNRKLPVWVFIYGGRRISGHAAPYKHGPHYIMDKQVIFVTMTYRIGPLGFLSTEDKVIAGNYGLKDELMVLQWIQEHISVFGGDASNVTISGGSTGAIDVGLLLMSHQSKGLFHRAISQSGHPLNTVLKPGVARRQAWELARLVNCGGENVTQTEHLLSCLRTVPVEVLIRRWSSHKRDRIFQALTFGPIIEAADVEGRFLIRDPYSELSEPSRIPWLMGINADEGTVGGTGLFVNEGNLNYFSQHLRKLLPIQLRYSDSTIRDKITDLVVDKYFANSSFQQSFHGYSKVFSLAHFISGALETAIRYNGPKYFYVYDHKNKVSYVRNYFLRGLICKQPTGVTHGEELRSLQHYPMLLAPIVSGEDRIVSDQMISLWYNFVARGDPNEPGSNGTKLWQPMTTSNVEYLHIANLTLMMKKRPFWEDYQFWKNLGNPSLSKLEPKHNFT